MVLASFDKVICLLIFVVVGLAACPSSRGQATPSTITTAPPTHQEPEDSPAGIVLKQADREVAVYHNSVVAYADSKASNSTGTTAPWYDRSGFVHPLRTPSGRIVTAAFPADHRHQHALMFAWTSSRVGDRKVDFWNSHKRQGHVEHVRTISRSPTQLVASLRHVDDTVSPSKIILEEVWRLETRPHPDVHILDLRSEQSLVSDESFVIEKYHYGALCVRGSDQWSGNVSMLTSESKTIANGNHTRPRWVAMFGEVDNAICGIAAINHPANFRYPQHTRLHPTMPYFSFFPAVDASFEIAAGEVYRSRFRFVAFDGKPDTELLDSLSDDFAVID
jgi:hypothetical protein